MKRRQDWQTPGWLFERLDKRYGFTVDAAATKRTAKLPRYWTPTDDGLVQPWEGERVFCNPPFGSIGPWVRKAAESAAFSVLIVPVRTETPWWCEWVLPHASEIVFVRGRLHFDPPPGLRIGPGGSRPVFATALLVYERTRTMRPHQPRLDWIPSIQLEQRSGFYTRACWWERFRR